MTNTVEFKYDIGEEVYIYDGIGQFIQAIIESISISKAGIRYFMNDCNDLEPEGWKPAQISHTAQGLVDCLIENFKEHLYVLLEEEQQCHCKK